MPTFSEIRAFTGSLGILSTSERQYLAALVEHADIVDDLSEAECKDFLLSLEHVRKDISTALLWAFFLGGVGAHHYYLKRTATGILYTVMTCTLVLYPVSYVLNIVDLFRMKKLVVQTNRKRALELKSMILASRART